MYDQNDDRQQLNIRPSSNIASASYDSQQQKLHVTFKNGGAHALDCVSEEEAKAFVAVMEDVVCQLRHRDRCMTKTMIGNGQWARLGGPERASPAEEISVAVRAKIAIERIFVFVGFPALCWWGLWELLR